jgi:parallel beta-helix repeat protein
VRKQYLSRLGLVIASLAVVGLWATGNAMASHVHCGDVIVEDTILDSDLIGCPATGLAIGAPGVTLDLNGHRLQGRGLFSGYYFGIDNSAGFDDVVIENGSVTEFEYGIVATGMDSSVLRSLSVVSNNLDGITLKNSDGNLIEHTVSAEHGFGIHLDFGSDDNRIEANTLTDNGGGGLVLSRSQRTLVRKNVLHRDGLGNISAIALYSSDGTRLEKNEVIDNPHFGIYLDRSANSHVLKNSVSGNTFGIFVEDRSHDNLLDQNQVWSNRDFGIAFAFAPGNTADQNSADMNGNGILIQSAADNRILRNSARANRHDGILVVDASATMIQDNRTDANGDDGIDVQSPGNTLRSNAANRNQDLGIFAAVGNTDAGKNTAHLNGNPLQCINVAC